MARRLTSNPGRANANREHGFTMIELLIAILLLSVVMAAIFSFLWGASSYWRTAQDAADVTENARMGLNRMVREIKQASIVTEAEAGQISFEVDFHDGTGKQMITYGYDGEGGTIWRSSGGGPEVTMVNNVRLAQFEYYGNDYRCDANNDGLVELGELTTCAVATNPLAKISRADIVLKLKSGEGSEHEFFGQAWLRNRNTAGGA
ncbi:MAG: prepilin-type N-terminal cleavage/methylation domain-containing protein [Thermoleophilia bacterium]|nr:prepilin-type N-terminal cleavage/methylation domain-containing protein [Thermoleophilia bacterium]